MDENKNNSELYGFDSVDNSEENNGYAVTPDGNYSYSEKSEPDTEPEVTEQESVPPTETEEYVPDFMQFEPEKINEPFVFNTVSVKPKREPRQKNYTLKALIVAVLIAAIIGASTGIGAMLVASNFFEDDTSAGEPSVDATPQGNVNLNVSNVDATVVEAVAAKVTPSVVGIRTTVSSYNFLYGEQESSGEGSGVVYSSDGYIITNYHVIQEAVDNRSENAKINVFLSYGDDTEGYPATIVGYNISCDLAVIKINATGLTPITLADSANLNVGQFVVAIGNPGGLQFMGSVTYGVISGLNRIVSDTGIGSGVELIQTDAAINPGNSGGALVNIKGELVGINSSKLVSESYEGMGFAIPTNTTKEICDKIISKENDPDPFLGVTINERYTADILQQYGYPTGAVVYSVVPGSPAEDAGITRNDIITELNGVEIKDYTMVGDALSDCKPGDVVSVKIYRNRRSYTLQVTLGSNNSQ